MTPDHQPTTPAGLHPETTVICAGRPGHGVGGPLNVPVVLASNFHAGAAPAPTWEALEAAVGQVEGGHAVAFSSGMAAIAPYSTSCRPAAASSPRKTVTSGSANCWPTPRSAGPWTAWT